MTRRYTHIKQYYKEMEKEEVTAEPQLHSDQNFQYPSQSYFALTRQYGITPSMSRRAKPYYNAMVKHFFFIFKSECIRLYKPVTILQEQNLINSYIAFYNRERILLNSKLSYRKTALVCVILPYPTYAGFISVFSFWNSLSVDG